MSLVLFNTGWMKHFLELAVSKSSIAKITGVNRTTLYNCIATRGLKADP